MVENCGIPGAEVAREVGFAERETADRRVGGDRGRVLERPSGLEQRGERETGRQLGRAIEGSEVVGLGQTHPDGGARGAERIELVVAPRIHAHLDDRPAGARGREARP